MLPLGQAADRAGRRGRVRAAAAAGRTTSSAPPSNWCCGPAEITANAEDLARTEGICRRPGAALRRHPERRRRSSPATSTTRYRTTSTPRSIAAMLPRGTLIVLPGIGHMPHHAAADVVIKAIDEIAGRGCRARRINIRVSLALARTTPLPAAVAHPAAISAAARATAVATHSRPAPAFFLSSISFFFGSAISPSRIAFLRASFRRPADRFGFFAVFPLGRLFVGLALLHFAKHAFALHFLFQDAERLVDVVVADEDLQGISFSELGCKDRDGFQPGLRRRQAHESLPGPGRSASAGAGPARRMSLQTATADSAPCPRLPASSMPGRRAVAPPGPFGGCAAALRWPRPPTSAGAARSPSARPCRGACRVRWFASS